MLRRSERRSVWRSRVLLWLCCLALILFILDLQGWLDPITNRTTETLAPVTRTLTTIRTKVGSVVGGVFGGGANQADVDALQAQITQLQNENLQLRSAATENTTLRRTAGMRERFGWRTVIANVVGRAPDNGMRMFTIDRGKNDGLAVGMPVVSHVNGSPDALIGLIDTISDGSATILLITDSRSVVSGQILLQQTNVATNTGTITQPLGDVVGQWQLGSRLQMQRLDRDARISVGDDVMTAGISRQINFDAPAARIPADIPIGKIKSVKPAGHGQQADVEPYFDPDSVRTVWIIVGED